MSFIRKISVPPAAKFLLSAVALLGSVCASALGVADNFNDNTRGSEWSLVMDKPAELSLREQNNRLEILATAPAAITTDALYLSNGAGGFRLSTAANFEIAIDYSFAAFLSAGAPGTALGVVFGIGRDAAGTDSASIGFLRANAGAPTTFLTEAHRTANIQTNNTLGSGSITGTFVIAYNTASDALTLGDGNTTFTLGNTVKTLWGASDLLVSFGARGNGFSTVSGNAYLDNFTVRSGTVIPEPAAVALLVFGALPLLCVRRRRP